jgi:pimeloyl-ACP methyl ester carboxylesterase
MLRLNAAGLRTIAYDRRGHGRSGDPGLVDYDLLAEDLSAILEALDLHDVIVVAHSGAGGEAVRYMTLHGHARIARLILVGGTLPAPMASSDNPEGRDPGRFEAQNRELAEDLTGWIEQNARPFVLADTPEREIAWLAGMVQGCSRRILVDLQIAIARADFRAELAALDLPITVIHGELDVSAPFEICARRIVEHARNGELLVYEGAPHGMMLTHTAQLADDITRLLDSGRGAVR